jgi:START domain
MPRTFKVCERSLSGTGGGPNAAAAHQFVRAEMLPSGYLVRPCEGGGSIVHIVDHLDLEVYMQNCPCLAHFLNCLHAVFVSINHFLCFTRVGMECTRSAQATLRVIACGCTEDDNCCTC